MDLTQEYLNQKLSQLATKSDLERFATKDDLKQLATKDDLKQAVAELVGIISETVATPMEAHFAEFRSELALHEEVRTLKQDVQRIKEALHVS